MRLAAPEKVIVGPEPFGQEGMRRHLLPTLVWALGICLAVSMSMWLRSQDTLDLVGRDGANSRVEFRSVIGRIVVDYVAMERSNRAAIAAEWYRSSQSLGQIQDGWQESWKKAVGVEWGWIAPQPRWDGGSSLPIWRLRVRWRTITLVYLVVLGLVWVRYRRRLVRQQTGSTGNSSGSPGNSSAASATQQR